jgi:hypothetical protein
VRSAHASFVAEVHAKEEPGFIHNLSDLLAAHPVCFSSSDGSRRLWVASGPLCALDHKQLANIAQLRFTLQATTAIICPLPPLKTNQHVKMRMGLGVRGYYDSSTNNKDKVQEARQGRVLLLRGKSTNKL